MLDQVSLEIEKVILNHYLHSQREYEIPNDRIPLRELGATYWEDRKHILEKKRGETLVMNIHQASTSTHAVRTSNPEMRHSGSEAECTPMSRCD